MSRSPLSPALFLAALATCSAPAQDPCANASCPAGFHCVAEGCVADTGPIDLAASGADLRLPCGGACAEPTPLCNDKEQCVRCLLDADCPAGTWCGSAPGTGNPACLPGCSDDTRCATMGAAWRCCEKRCVDTAVSPEHCGACGTTCHADHAAASCVASACAPGACDTSWADCNGEARDGCEVNTRLDIAHCGGCNKPCVAPHGTPACSGTCYLAMCDFGWDDCNGDPADGCEAGTLSDVKSCGGCGMACGALAHAKVACVNASCVPAGCDAGFADCDRAAPNGCEVSLTTDARNCGACGMACPQGLVCRNSACTCQNCNFANARSMCVNNVCVMGACDPGFADCNKDPKDGCEIDLTSDVKSCGQCGTVCPNNLPTCTNSMCTACGMSIANSGAGDFHIAFTIQTAAVASSTVICQRATCDHGLFWDVRMSPAGILNLELDDNNVAYTTLSSVRRVNDNAAHAVEIRRIAGTVHLFIDGNEEASRPCATTFGALAPLAFVTGDPCEGRDGTVALNGKVTNVCLTVP